MKIKRFFWFVVLTLVVATVMVGGMSVTANALTVTDSTIADTDAQFTYSYTTELVKNNDGLFHSDKFTSGVGTSGLTKAANADGSVTLTLTAVSTYYYKSWGVGCDAKDGVTTLTLTNSTDNLLAVAYKDSTIPGYAGSGTFYINPNSKLTMTVTADTGASNTSSIVATGSITITGIEVAILETVNFYSSQYGSYTWTVGDANGSVAVGSEAISSAVAATTSAYANTSLTATVTDVTNDGYKFVGWVSGGKVLGTGTTLSTVTDGAMDIYPLFVAEDAVASFTVNGTEHYYWLTAMNASASSGKPAILTGDYTLPGTLAENGMRIAVEGMISGTDGALTYTVPNGAKLLIPRNSSDTGTFSTSISGTESASTRSAYVTLTIPTGTKVSVLGAMNVNGIPREADDTAPSTVSGSYGHVHLAEGGTLSMGSGSTLYCYGYITGDGTVEVLNGSYVYEILQIGDWKGGNAVLNWSTNAGNHTNPVFAISQYFVQNIESDLVIHAGATEGATTYLQTFGCCSADFIGSTGMFYITTGNILRSFDPVADQVTYTLRDGAVLNMQNLTIPYSYSIFSGTLNSGDYIFAVPNNMSFRLTDGTTMNLTSDIRMLPGSEIIVDEGANLNVKADLYIYGTTDWMSGRYADTSFFARTAYIASIGAASYRTVDMSTPSAKLRVNGTMTVTSDGGVFASGAEGSQTDPSKVIEGTGTIINGGSTAAHVITEYTRVSTEAEPVEIQFQSAQMRLAGVSANDNDYANLGTSTTEIPYRGLGEYWYTTTVSVIGATDQISGAACNQIKDNGDGTYEIYATTQARIALNDGYVAKQGDTILSVEQDRETGTVSFVTTDLTTPITIAAGDLETVEVTVNVVSTCLDGCTGTKGDSYSMEVVSGAAISGYYSDEACTTPVTSVTEDATLYFPAQAKVEWASGKADTYYATFNEAMVAAVNSGDAVTLLGDVNTDRAFGAPAGKTITVNLNRHTITYDRTMFYVSGTLNLNLQGGTIVNNTAADKMAAITAIYTYAGGVLNMDMDGGTLKWWAPEADTDPDTETYTYSWKSQTIYTPVYNYAGGTVNIDMVNGGTIQVDYPVALYQGYNADKDTRIRNRLYALYNAGTMNITGAGDGTGVITGNTYAAKPTAESLVDYALDLTMVSSTGGTIYAQTTILTYGEGSHLTLNGVTVKNTATAGDAALTAVVTAHRSNLTLRNSTITGAGNDPYCLLNVGTYVDEITNCKIDSGRGGIYNVNNRQTLKDESGNDCGYAPLYVGRIEKIEDSYISGWVYGIYNLAQIGTITGNSTITENRSNEAYNSYAIYNDYRSAGTNAMTEYWTWSADGTTKTVTSAVEDRPTIESITGNTQVVGKQYGYGIFNLGYIQQIGGNAVIRSGSKYTSLKEEKYYCPLYNNGGVIDTIGGNAIVIAGTVTDNEDGTQTLTPSGVRAILQMGQREVSRIETYEGGVQTKRVSTYQLATIGEISGEGTNGVRISGKTYTILNFGEIDTISGKTTISASTGRAIHNAGDRYDLYVHSATEDDGTVTTTNVYVPGYTAATTPYTSGTAGTAVYTYTPSSIGDIGGEGAEVLIDAVDYSIVNGFGATIDCLGAGGTTTITSQYGVIVNGEEGKVGTINTVACTVAEDGTISPAGTVDITGTNTCLYVDNYGHIGTAGASSTAEDGTVTQTLKLTQTGGTTGNGAVYVKANGVLDTLAAGEITGINTTVDKNSNAIYSNGTIHNVGASGHTLDLTADYRVINLNAGSVTDKIAPVGSVVNIDNTSDIGIVTYNTAKITELGAGGTLNINTKGTGIYIRNTSPDEVSVETIGNGGTINITSTNAHGIQIGTASYAPNVGEIAANGAVITIKPKASSYGITVLGKDASNVTQVGTIGAGGTIKITQGYRGINLAAYTHVDTIGQSGTVDIDVSQYGIYVDANATVENMASGGTMTIDQKTVAATADDGTVRKYSGIYVAGTGNIGNIGGQGASLTINAPTYGIYVDESATVGTIGLSGSTVKVAAKATSAVAPYCIYVLGEVTTLGEKGSTITLTPTFVDTIDGYGVYLTGADAKLTNVGGTLTVKANAPGGSGDVAYGFYVNDGANITNLGTPGSTITVHYANSSKYVCGLYVNGAGSTVNNVCVGTEDAPSSFTVKGRFGMDIIGTADGDAKVDLIGGPYSTISMTTYKNGIHGNYADIGTIGSPNSSITVSHYGTGSNTSYGIWLQNSTVDTIGNGATIKLSGKSNSDSKYSSGIYIQNSSTVTTIGGTGTKISTTDSSSYVSYGLYIASGSKVETLGDGSKLLDLCGRYGIRCNGTIGELGAGVLARSTAEDSSYAALYVTSSGSVDITGGYFHHASGERELTVVNEGGTVTYAPEGYGVSYDTTAVTLNDGTSKDCYYITLLHTHDYSGAPEFVWTQNEDGSYSVTATLTCQGENCPDEPFSGTAKVTSETTDPTCTADGATVYTAKITLNGTEYSENKTDVISATGHTYANPVVTFAADGTTYTVTVTCSACADGTEGHTVTSDALSSTVSGSTAGDCLTNSTTTYSASGTYKDLAYSGTQTVDGDKGEHSLTKTEAKTATCTEAGNVEYWTCSVCKKNYDANNAELNDVQIPESGHSWTKATCTEAKTCSVCEQTEGEALGHTEVIDEAVTPTCTTAGKTEGKHCSVCDEVLVEQTEVAALGHTEETLAVVAATCYSTGLTEGKKCTVCGVTTVEQTVTEKIAHTPAAAVEENRVESTCSVAGSYDSVVYCSVEACKAEISRETKSLALAAHTEGEVKVENEVAATCTAEGSYDNVVYCTVCGEELSRETITVDVLGHTKVIDAAVAPTCTETGLTEGKHCSACNEVLVTQTVVDALGHKYDSVVTEPDYNNQGYTTHTCSVCGDTYKDSYVAALKGIAAINGYNYGTLQEAMVAAISGDTVTLLTDVTINAEIATISTSAGQAYTAVMIPEGITLDGKSYTLTVTGADSHTWSSGVYMTGGTLKNLTIAGGKRGVLINCPTADVTIEGVSVSNSLYALNTNSKGPNGAVKLTVTNSIFNGWTSVSNTSISEVTFTNCRFGKSNRGEGMTDYAYFRPYCDTTLTNCTFSEEFEINIGNADAQITADAGLNITSGVSGYMVVYEDGTYSLKKIVAKIGDVTYASLEKAVAAAQNGNTIVLVIGGEYTTPVVLGDGVTLDLNGQTIKATVIGTISMNGGTLITAEDYKMAGPDADYYQTTDAVVTIFDNGDITVQSGSMTVVPNEWWTGKGQTLTIAEGATFVIPEGKKMQVLSTVIIKGELTLNGTLNLYSTDATVQAKAGLNITTTAGDKVLYTNGKYVVHNHTVVTDKAVAPTCTATGLTEGKHCETCSDILVAQTEIPANGHTEGETVVENNVDPTCTVAGSYDNVVYCTVCDAELSRETVTVDALGHTEVVDAAVAPTCTETGLTEGKHCSVCGEVLVAQEVVAATGHAWTDEFDTECNNGCGETRKAETYANAISTNSNSYGALSIDGNTVTLNAEGEIPCAKSAWGTWGRWVGFRITVPEGVDAATAIYTRPNGNSSSLESVLDSGKNYASVYSDMTTYGDTATYQLDWNGDGTADLHVVIDVTNATLVHKYTAVVTEPTCTDAGYTTYTCGCGDSYTADETAALGHTWNDATFDSPKTCSACGETEGNALIAVAKIGDQRYQTLDEAVENAKAGETVTLLGSFTGAGVVIDKSITINFAGYTYTLTDPVGSVGTVTNGFQLLKNNNITLKNGTLNVAEESKDQFYILVQNYANLTVTDMTLDGTNLDKWALTDGDSYVLSNNSGTVNVTGGTNIKANDDGDKAFAFDVFLKSGYDAPVVNVETTGKIEGRIEVSESISDNLNISSGTYTVEIAENWCADGFIPTANGDGTYGVKVGSYVAEVGGVKYETLAEALTAVQDGNTVTLLADINTDSAFVINKTVTLNLNGFDVKTTENDNSGDGVFYVVSGGDLTIYGEGEINGVGGNDYCIAIWADGGKVTINGGTYTNVGAGDDDHYDLIYVKNGGSVAINGGTFIAETPAWTLNSHDTNKGTIIVYGGNFHDFNPYNNAAEGTNTNFVADGYHASADETGVYTIHTCIIETLEAVEPDCTNTGLTEGKKCTECGEILVDQEVVAALGHTEGVVVVENNVAPDCENTGSYDNVVYCTVCDAELSRATITVDALGHTEVIDAAVAPTCTATGLTEGKHCSVCDKVLIAQETVAANGHTDGDAVTENEVAATCAADGSYDNVTYCTVCGAETGRETVTVDALGHTEVIDAAVAPTCTATGLTEGKHCSVCNEVLIAQSVVDALGHTEVIDAAVAPTCTATGLTEGKKCTECGEILVAQEVVDALGHTKGQTVVENNVDPTCTVAGSYDDVVYCTVCDAELSRETATVDALGHTVVIDAAVAPTCTATGLTEGKHCSVCNEVLVAQETVDVLEHSYDSGVVTTAPTTTSTGVRTYTCTVCGDTKTEEIPVLTGYVVTLDNRTIEGDNKATTGLVSGQRYAPGETFTVKCAMACVVAISKDGGESYTELSCVAVMNEDDTYQFTIPTNVTGDFKIGIVLRGDANGDGKVRTNDATRILRWYAGGFGEKGELDQLTELAADANGKQGVRTNDATRILKWYAGGFDSNNTLDWKLEE